MIYYSLMNINVWSDSMRFKVKENILWCFALLFFFPLAMKDTPLYNHMFALLDMGKLLVIFYILITRKREIKLDCFSILFIIYCLSYLIPSIFMRSLDFATFVLWLRTSFFSLAFIFLMQKLFERDYYSTIQALYYSLSGLCISHVILYYILRIMVLGIRTRYTDYALPSVIFLAVLVFGKNKRINFWDILFIFSGLWFTYAEGVSTGLLIIMIFLFIIITIRIPLLLKIYSSVSNFICLFVSTLVINILIVVFRVQDLLSFIIVDFLHEDMTFNGRTLIWDCVFEQLKEHRVLLGAGIQKEGSKDIKMLAKNEYGDLLLTDRQAHNQLLDVFFFRGIVGLISYIGLILLSGVNIKYADNEKIKIVYCLGIFLYGLAMITELAADSNMFLAFLASVYYLKYLKSPQIEKNEYKLMRE